MDVRLDLAADLKRLLLKLKGKYLLHEGRQVDYAGLKQSPEWNELQAGLDRLKHLDLVGWSEAEQRAFWINLYNVLVLHRIVTGGSPGSNPLKLLWFTQKKCWTIGTFRFSLDDIEHGLLRENRRHPYLPYRQLRGPDPRKTWTLPLDPRIHFALNCGAKSCPPIGVYLAEQVDQQLQTATASYLLGEVEIAGNVLWLPMLLRWYGADFGGRKGIAQWLSQIANHSPEALLQLRWKYRPYDWTVNSI